MIRRLILAAAAILAGMGVLAFESKAQSIHPFYEDDDVVFRPELVGKWKVEGVPVEFAAAGANGYVIRLGMESDTRICFSGHVIRLDGRYFLDAQITGLKLPSSKQTPDAMGNEPNNDTKSKQNGTDSELGSCSEQSSSDSDLLNREHVLFQLNFTSDPDSFEVEFWDDAWANEMTQQKKWTVPFTRDEDDEKHVLFFGNRSEMRGLVISLPAEAFGDSVHLERVSSDAAIAK